VGGDTSIVGREEKDSQANDEVEQHCSSHEIQSTEKRVSHVSSNASTDNGYRPHNSFWESLPCKCTKMLVTYSQSEHCGRHISIVGLLGNVIILEDGRPLAMRPMKSYRACIRAFSKVEAECSSTNKCQK